MTAPPAPWTEYTWEGIDGWLWDAKVFVEKNYDPESGVCVVFLAPPGGRATVPAMARGDRGFSPIIDPDVDITAEIEWDDPDPVTSTWETTNPGDANTPPTIKESRTVRKGAPGTPGSFTFLSATDLVGTPVAGYFPVYVADTGLAVGAPATSTPGALWAPPKVGGIYWPAAMLAAADGDNSKTLCTIPIPPMPWPYWAEVVGQSLVTGTGPNVAVDIIARIGGELDGDEIARAFGRAGVTPPPHVLVSGPPTGSASTYGRVAANTAATIYVRAERQSGSDSFTTATATSRYFAKVHPIP